jgi:hypothetical protein
LKVDKIPSAVPFLTTSTREFAFSALNQNFVVPGSCPNNGTIDLPIFDAVVIETQNIQPQPQTIQFSIAIPTGGIPSSWRSDCSGLSFVWINQQNTPIVEKLLNIQIDLKNLRVTFEAQFPFEPASFGNGLTIVAITNSTGPFATANAVAANTIFGPGLIEIN